MDLTRPRYAIYFTPDPKSALWRFGSGVIGYDAYIGTDVPLAAPAGFDTATWARLTEEPRRYGFHATLKAPFHLVERMSEGDLCAAVEALAGGAAAIGLGPLAVRVSGDFAALYNEGCAWPVSELATAVVKALEPFRAPLTEYDRKRRYAASLTWQQQQYLELYGYPYVLEQFRFHMTLTGRLPVEDRRRVELALAAAWVDAQGAEAVVIDALSVLRQDRRDGRFRVIARFALRAQTRSAAAPA